MDFFSERFGAMEFYDKTYDRVTSKTEKPLLRIARTYYPVTTTDDPVIQKVIQHCLRHINHFRTKNFGLEFANKSHKFVNKVKTEQILKPI